jgi:predicted nuclease of predicted toxin-antitoxin system
MQRQPELDIRTVEDAGLRGTPDPQILEWAARESRVLITHDKRTMKDFAYDRVRRGLSMPGVVELPMGRGFGPVLEDILLLALALDDSEIADRVVFLPL